MKVVVFGIGGVGGYYGGRLAAAGADVTFVTRSGAPGDLGANGLTIESALGDLVLPTIKVASDTEAPASADVILLTVKMYDLMEAAERLARLVRRGTAIVCVQNGIEAADMLRKRLPDATVLPAVVYGSTIRVAPQRIRHVGRLARIVFGGAGAERFAEPFAAAGLDASAAADIDSVLWGKFVMFATISAACCLARAPTGAVLGDERGRVMLDGGFAEVARLARAKGIAVAPDEEARAFGVVDRMDPSSRPSMLEDLEARRPLELEWLSGAVARLGRAHDVPTPFHDIAYAALGLHARGAGH
jgi:2-dehydropantoate 2-reductase